MHFLTPSIPFLYSLFSCIKPRPRHTRLKLGASLLKSYIALTITIGTSDFPCSSTVATFTRWDKKPGYNSASSTSRAFDSALTMATWAFHFLLLPFLFMRDRILRLEVYNATVFQSFFSSLSKGHIYQ